MQTSIAEDRRSDLHMALPNISSNELSFPTLIPDSCILPADHPHACLAPDLETSALSSRMHLPSPTSPRSCPPSDFAPSLLAHRLRALANFTLPSFFALSLSSQFRLLRAFALPASAVQLSRLTPFLPITCPPCYELTQHQPHSSFPFLASSYGSWTRSHVRFARSARHRSHIVASYPSSRSPFS